MIKLQNEMQLPIGLVLKESGHKLPDTHLINPITAMRRMKIAEYTLPLLLKRERKLRKKLDAPRPAELPMNADPDMRVF